MAFLNPAAFYLLGLIPIVIALHFLKLRRQRFVVSSIMLWRESAEDQKANVPFQRLRNLVLPILQSIFLLLIVASVARPALRVPGIIPGKIILIIDNSASMQAQEMSETRLNLAKQEAIKQIKQVSATGGMMIMTTHSPPPHIIQAFTTDTDKLILAVENINPTSIRSRGSGRTSVFDQAAPYVDSVQDQIIFISDSFEDLPETSVPIAKILVGNKADNVGIIRLNIERIADQFKVLVGIQNWTDSAKEIDVRLELEGGRSIDEKTISLPAGDVRSVLFSIRADGLEGEIISLHLADVGDDFALDNRVWSILSTKRLFPILLVSDRNQSFLIDLLRNYGDNVELQTVSSDEFHTTGNADVVIFDGALPLEQADLNNADTKNVVFINWRKELPLLSSTPVEITKTVANVISENKAHPTMHDVSLMGLRVKESIIREVPIWGDSLLETEKGALIWLGIDAGRRFLVLEFDAFNPEISPFAFEIPNAPLLIFQCLTWFESNTYPIQSLTDLSQNTDQLFRTGELLKIDLPTVDEITVQVKKPDNSLINLENGVFEETDQVGVYSVMIGESVFERFVVNLVDAQESELSHPTSNIPEGEAANENGYQLQLFTREVWQWSVLLAICLLLCEWWFYHRN